MTPVRALFPCCSCLITRSGSQLTPSTRSGSQSRALMPPTRSGSWLARYARSGSRFSLACGSTRWPSAHHILVGLMALAAAPAGIGAGSKPPCRGWHPSLACGSINPLAIGSTHFRWPVAQPVGPRLGPLSLACGTALWPWANAFTWAFGSACWPSAQHMPLPGSRLARHSSGSAAVFGLRVDCRLRTSAPDQALCALSCLTPDRARGL